MEQIDKHQQDWDKTINDNFAKFEEGSFTDNVIYLNGANKSTKHGFPLNWKRFDLGVVALYEIEGYIDLPTIKAGQEIDIINIPGAGALQFAIAQLADDFLSNNLYIHKSSKPGTLCIHNSSTSDVAAHTSMYQILMTCPVA